MARTLRLIDPEIRAALQLQLEREGYNVESIAIDTVTHGASIDGAPPVISVEAVVTLRGDLAPYVFGSLPEPASV